MKVQIWRCLQNQKVELQNQEGKQKYVSQNSVPIGWRSKKPKTSENDEKWQIHKKIN